MLKILVPNDKRHFFDAAQVFGSMYCAITGKTPEIVNEDDPSCDIVLLGSDSDSSLLHDLMLAGRLGSLNIRYGTDEYRILSFKDNDNERTILILAGGNIRSTFYAVYDFFERVANCRYFWDGDIIPKAETIDIENIDVIEKPRFEYRGLRYFAHRSLSRFQAEHWDFDDWKKEFDWVLKKRLNLAMLRIGIDDLFQKAFPDVVPYPEYDKRLPEAVDRSFDDRTLFWSLEYRGELRRKIHEYGRSRGLMQPEDCGTMTHWYSRTPNAFLEKFNPAFVPQSNNNYNEPTGLVWDIRDDVNMDRYFKLTEAHVQNYGDGRIFHTIGLAERKCFDDRDKNQKMKLYAYRRIIEKLRTKYPDAPLLVASWDFVSTWSHDEVKALIAELDPSNTVILDYTSDIFHETNNFRNWGLVGKFPWIFGIFHAFEASSEMRGAYDHIADRFPIAAEDPMCKGVVFWPENSHQDTLMLEYFPAIAWNPALYRIREFVTSFCQKRYETKADTVFMEKIWQDSIELAKLALWGAWDITGPAREFYPDMYFMIGKNWGTCIYGEIDAKKTEFFHYKCETTLPHIDNAVSVIKRLATLDYEKLTPFMKRDAIDIARMIFSRIMNFAIPKSGLMIESWRNSSKQWLFDGKIFEGADIISYFKDMKAFAKCLTELLEAAGEFSLNVSLEELKMRHETNPNFEYTLKGNAENGYCRSFIYELARECYEPALEMYSAFAEKRVLADDKSTWTGLTEKFRDDSQFIVDAFYEKPLAEMAPDIEKAVKKLPATLEKMAELISKLKGISKS